MCVTLSIRSAFSGKEYLMNEENKEFKDFKELELKDDFMFGVIMSREKYCRPFLEIVLRTRNIRCMTWRCRSA